jgi:hypothetical protein
MIAVLKATVLFLFLTLLLLLLVITILLGLSMLSDVVDDFDFLCKWRNRE